MVVSIFYIIVVGYLGVFVRDDFFALTFPSWPFLINCFENCGYKIFVALCANGILVWALSFFVISIAFYAFTFTKNVLTRKEPRAETK